MAVATTTTMIVPKLVPSSSKSTATSLRSLYQRAAHSFLHRDVPLTYSLVTSAFALLASTAAGLGSLHEQKRKWDVLRITLEVTVYTSPPEDSASIPAPLRSNAMLSGPSLINMLHTRSLALFCPGNISKPDAAFLPAPILVTLAAASVKVNAPDVGRLIIEDWLARRGNGTHVLEDPEEDGYAKVIDVYCTSVLPALEEWDYATEFLQYEGQLDESIKASISRTLASLHSEHRSLSASMPHLPPSSSSDLPDTPSTSSSPTPTPSRPISPSSSSESISTSSTHTAVPPTPKGRPMNGLTPVSPAPQKPSQPHSAVTSRTVTPISGARRLAPPFRVPSSNGHAAPSSRSSAQVTAPPRASSVNALTLMQSFLRTYFTRNLSLSRTVAVLLLLVLPVVSIIFRLRRRRVPPSTQTLSSTSGAVADVRRRLGAQKESGLLQILWQEVTRAIGDTVRMGGRGLV